MEMNKFFNNLNYKSKIFGFSSLLLTTSIVCPLTSCGSDDTSNDIGEFDKEFGFDTQTYVNLERQFISKYGAYLRNKVKDDDEYTSKLENFLKNDLTILRNKLYDPTKNYSFTFRTNTLIDYASSNFNINLNRNTNVSNIDFDNLKQSSLENFVIYMENMGFSNATIDEKKVEFNNKFDEILENCKSKTSDNAQILMQLRADVINCWQDVNNDLAYLSACNHLKKFFDEYEFLVKEQEVNDNNVYLWDNLLNNPGFMGGDENTNKIDQDINHEISVDWINKLFYISKKSEESEKKEDDKVTPANDNSSNEILTYSKEIIPGFILTPVLKTMSRNIYSNEYCMTIDWQLIYAKYKDKDQETIDKVTAHLVTPKNEKALDYTDFKDGQLSSNDYQFTAYGMLATPSYQQLVMNEAYFDQTKQPDQKITFSWDKDAIGIEYFLPSDAKSAKFEVPKDRLILPMGRSNLSLIGLQLNGTNLSDLLNKKIILQDNKSINVDDNLKIEEKFVKYCDISTIADVVFPENNLNTNTIQNNFTASFTNSNLKFKVATKSNMNNIGPSKNFSKNAINFYKQVADYVDAAKIEKNIEEWHEFSQILTIGIYVMIGFCVLLLICVLARWLYYTRHWSYIPGPNEPQLPQVGLAGRFQSFVIIFVFVLIIMGVLYFTWLFTVSVPISNEVDNVKKWNDKLNGTESDDSDTFKDVNVINKVKGDDKNNFASVDNFMKYYDKYSNTAFGSYFYYFYFIELSQNRITGQSTILDRENNKIVKQDYNKFDETKKKCGIEDRKVGRVIIAAISAVVILTSIILIIINIVLTCKLASAWRQYAAQLHAVAANPPQVGIAGGGVPGHDQAPQMAGGDANDDHVINPGGDEDDLPEVHDYVIPEVQPQPAVQPPQPIIPLLPEVPQWPQPA